MTDGSPGGALRFWEHPDMTQLIELMCLNCLDIHYLGRKKHQPYPCAIKCQKCGHATLPTQEKRDWLKSLARQAASEESA